jgi:hypothetical protein
MNWLSLVTTVWMIGNAPYLPDETTNARQSMPIINADNSFSKLSSYPRNIGFDGKDYSANIMLMYFEPLSPVKDVFFVWFLRVAWVEWGQVVEINMAPYLSEADYLSAFFNNSLNGNLMSTRFVKTGELKFLEKDFIESLPLVIRQPTGIDRMDFLPRLFFCVFPNESNTGCSMGYYKYTRIKKVNSDYYRLAEDFFTTIPWIFANWLIEDGHDVNKEWLKFLKFTYPKKDPQPTN